MATIDVASLMNESFGVAEGLEGVGNMALDITNRLAGISEDKMRASRSTAQASATMVEAEFIDKAQQEATRKSIAARLGTDASTVGWKIGKTAEDVAAADAELAIHSEAIRQKDSVSFLDNPLQYILNQATINQDIAGYNAAARKKNNAEDTARTLGAMTTQAYQNNDALTSVVSQSYIDAAKIVTGHKFNVEAQDAAAQALRWNLEGIQASVGARKDRLQVLYSANSAAMQEKQFQNEVQRLSIARQDFDLRKQAAEEKSNEDSLVLRYVQKGYFNLTGRQMDGARAKDALVLYKAKQPDVVAYFNSGLDSYSISDGGSRSVISLSPYDASTLVATNKVSGLPPAQMQVGEKLIEWRREFESPAIQTQMQLDKKDKTSVERAFNQFVLTKKQMELGNVSKDSVFAPADIRQVAAVNKTVGALPVWKNVLGPAAATGVDINDPNIAMGVVISAMNDGKLSYVDAVDISTVYAAGLDLNNQSRNLLAMGLSPVKTYNTAVNLPGQLGKTTVNFVDQKAIATALNKALASRASDRMTFGRSSSPFTVN